MGFADSILTEDLDSLRQRLLFHPLWAGIEQGTLPRETLRVFALQDWWLVREAYRLDALAIAAMADLELQDLLLANTGCWPTARCRRKSLPSGQARRSSSRFALVLARR
jgi:thiaminase